MAEPDDTNVRELSSRSANGVDIALVWQRCDNTATVVVVDQGVGEAFLLDVRENDDALDIFHHPYAYAAHRGIDHRWLVGRQGFRIAA